MEYGRPDTYVQNVQGVAPMEGAGTSTLGVVGICEKGAVNEPVKVTSFAEFTRKFGNIIATSSVGYAVKGFFENGGANCVVNRVVHYTDGAKTSVASSLDIQDSTPATIATVTAKYDGLYGDAINVEIKDISGDKFTMVVYAEDGEVQTHEEITMATFAQRFESNPYVTVSVADDTKMPVALAKTPLAGGNDGLTSIGDTDYVGSSADGTGLYAFDGVEIDLLLVAGVTTTAVHSGMITYCAGRKDCEALIEIPLNKTRDEAITYINTFSGEFASVFYNGLVISDPLGTGLKTITCGGHIAGVIARTDAVEGVWKAPAGTKANVLGIIGLEHRIKPEDHALLNKAHINVVKLVDGFGFCIWGARTLDRTLRKYLNSQRTNLYVAKTLKSELKWAEFENNDATLQRKVKGVSSAFLNDMWRQGGLKGNTPEEAFFVKCDSENNPPESVDAGKLYVDIGIATQKPAEFIIFRLSLI